MTNLEAILLTLLWIVLGLFMCYKANWFEEYRDDANEHIALCILLVIICPVSFIWNFINRFFIEKWN